jgi:hypothetical protein
MEGRLGESPVSKIKIRDLEGARRPRTISREGARQQF